ncbi:MAG: hypothetical protein MGG11_01900 [Trichodesmium sp. MAG_R03]|nr:hypothetical protein [Trichodesmium sp. MAG_R03]
MAGSNKLASWKIELDQNNDIFVFISLEAENSFQNQTVTTNKNINRLQSDWSGYCDELDPY